MARIDALPLSCRQCGHTDLQCMRGAFCPVCGYMYIPERFTKAEEHKGKLRPVMCLDCGSSGIKETPEGSECTTCKAVYIFKKEVQPNDLL